MEYSNQVAEQPPSTRMSGSACDTCRRRRVKCSGNQPCERCMKSGLSCTFGSSANRTSATSYARHLEQKVAELQTLLCQRPSIYLGNQAKLISLPYELSPPRSVEAFIEPGDDFANRSFESEIFHGYTSKFSVLTTSVNQIPQLSDDKWIAQAGQNVVQAFETLTMKPHLEFRSREHTIIPSKADAQKLTHYAIKRALICYDCVDEDELRERLNDFYEIDPEDYALEDKQFLCLVYALLALARRWTPLSKADVIDETSEKVRIKGLGYFHSSCDLLNATALHNLDSIRAVICQARYLVSISLVSRAYSQVCIGIGAALRLGLHTSSVSLHGDFSDAELLQRRRVFASLYLMETYLVSILGIPKILRDPESEPIIGMKEEDLARLSLGPCSNSTDMSMLEAMACQKLYHILVDTVEDRFSMQRRWGRTTDGTPDEDFDLVKKREAELMQWHSNLLAFPETKPDARTVQAQLTLVLCHAHVQINLYRPYLHHLTRDLHDEKFSMRGYECASACVRAAMQAVWVVEAFQKHNVLYEAFWLNTYMLGFSASILTFFVLCSAQRTTLEESTIAARKAQDLLASLAKYNLFARRSFLALKPLVDALPG